MKSLSKKILFIGLLAFGAVSTNSVSAQYQESYYFDTATAYPASQTYVGNKDYISQLLSLIAILQAQIADQQSSAYSNSTSYYGYGNAGNYIFGPTPSIGRNSSSNNDQEPDVDTKSAKDIQDDSAELRGDVDMNDFQNGIVFFVYGQDEDMIEDVEDDYEEYRDVKDDEDDDDFEVVRVDSDLDDDDRFEEDVNNLEEDERYYYIICVEYEDEDDDETLECGDVEDFETDGDNNNEKPDAETKSASNIRDDRAELRGEVDMNDFDNGRVFFVWGEDEDDVEDVENEDRFSDITEQGDDLRVSSVKTDHDNSDNFELDVFSLDDDTRHYFRMCVQYEDEDDDETLECGDVEDFETDN
jgi:hypothetical protein